MYLNRSIDSYLTEWKNRTFHKPLLLRGARQVGKSTAVRHLGEQFEFYIEANFEKNVALKTLFTSDKSVRDIAASIGALYNTPVEAGKTLLFLDEIQACPEALHALWFFKEDFPELHVIAAGSLLELALKELPSFGVGRVTSRYMYPLSFDEFLRATGHEMWIDAKKKATSETPLFDALHIQLVNAFRTFLMTGGMPASVLAWVENNDFSPCQEAILEIADSYSDDFNKYAKKISPELLKAVLRSAVQQIGKKFIYSHVEGGYNSTEVKKALGFLCDAGILYRVQHTAANGIPLGAEVNPKFAKYILLDSGLLLCLLNMGRFGTNPLTASILLDTASDLVNKGSLTEMVSGLELIKYGSPMQKPELFYWENLDSGTMSEVDYVINRNMQVVPIEVKSGTSGKMKSLRVFMEKKHLHYAIRSTLENFSKLAQDGIDILPLYALSNI